MLTRTLKYTLADRWDTIQWNQGHSVKDDLCHLVFGTVGFYHVGKHTLALFARHALPHLLRIAPTVFRFTAIYTLPIYLGMFLTPTVGYYRRVVEQGNKRYYGAKGLN